MLTLVTGPPGTGKSWYSVRQHLLALQRGKYVATNVQLYEGWAVEFAKQNHIDRFFDFFSRGKSRIESKAKRYEELTFISGDLQELFRVRIPPCGKCRACNRGRTCNREGRGVMILDEAHEWLNARTWNMDDTGQKLDQSVAVANRLRVVKFFALHRKLWWDVLLITQSEKRLDNQVRDNFEFHTKLKNMKKFKVWGLVRVIPFNWFWAITFWHASGGERVGLSSYLLIRKIADCYDTMARSEVPLGEEEEDVIRLPLSERERAARVAGEWASLLSDEEAGLVQASAVAEEGAEVARSAPRPSRPGQAAPGPSPSDAGDQPPWVV